MVIDDMEKLSGQLETRMTLTLRSNLKKDCLFNFGLHFIRLTRKVDRL